jgi:hypothetical protein
MIVGGQNQKIKQGFVCLPSLEYAVIDFIVAELPETGLLTIGFLAITSY